MQAALRTARNRPPPQTLGIETMRIDTDEIKAASEAAVKQSGGQVCDWLPYIEPTTLRDPDSVIARALILNAMINIYLGAPTVFIKAWIEKHDLTDEISPIEADILSRNESELTEQEKINLRQTPAHFPFRYPMTLMWCHSEVPLIAS